MPRLCDCLVLRKEVGAKKEMECTGAGILPVGELDQSRFGGVEGKELLGLWWW